MYRLKIHGEGIRLIENVPKGTVLLDILRAEGYELYSPCGGNGTCGKCRVYLRDKGYVTSCLYPVTEDAEIVLPEKSEIKVLTAQYRYSRQLDPDPGEHLRLSSRSTGVAIDVGTTTLVFHFIRLSAGSLIETHTAQNPQAKYGADVISRINYCLSVPNGLKILQKELIDTVNLHLARFIGKAGGSERDIIKLCFSGNTTMLHILLGMNPGPLAFAPFTPAFTGEKTLRAAELQLSCNPDGLVKILPSLSAYVGADIVAGIATLAPQKDHQNFLFVDMGTNGEIALITPDTIYCCAAASGPAFEGANIECGMTATEGAIMRYYESANFQVIGDVKPVGLCGSGLIDVVASLVRTLKIPADGHMEENIIVVSGEESGTSQDIYLTPKDIREVQLAKSAIAAGISILMGQGGLSVNEINVLYLAGGFGNYIRSESAANIGLIPFELYDKVIPVGNASGTGAFLSAKSVVFDKIINELLSKMKYFELSDNPGFIEQFAMNIDFPSSGKC